MLNGIEIRRSVMQFFRYRIFFFIQIADFPFQYFQFPFFFVRKLCLDGGSDHRFLSDRRLKFSFNIFLIIPGLQPLLV